MIPILRNAIPADVNAIANVYLRARKEFLPFTPLIHSDESIRQWIRYNLLVKEHVIVAEERGIIIGMMSLTKIKK